MDEITRALCETIVTGENGKRYRVYHPPGVIIGTPRLVVEQPTRWDTLIVKEAENSTLKDESE